MLQSPELDGRVERSLIELAAASGRDVSAAAIGAVLVDAAGHTADALPELLVLARGGERFESRLRPYLGEVIHCLASALEAALIASSDAELAEIGGRRGEGEDGLSTAIFAFLDRDRG